MADAKKKRISIFTNENVFNLSDPQPTWLFDVLFYKTSGPTMIETKHMVADRVSLPEFSTEIVTKNFMGSERSYPVMRTYGTDIELGFTLRTEFNDNKELFRLAQINARAVKAEGNLQQMSVDETDYYLHQGGYGSPIFPIHPEVETEPALIKASKSWYYYNIDKIEVRLKDKTGYNLKTSNKTGTKLSDDAGNRTYYSTCFIFQNCILTNMSFDSGLDYESEDMLRCTLTYHSDIWRYASMDTAIADNLCTT